MKNLIQIAAILFIISSSKAQFSGSVAPNFTGTDLNGNTHTLSTYLNSNKPVILDFNSVNCGPCWTYHRNDHLDDFYRAYGPQGSNEAMVLFIESSYSNVNDLNGISNPPAFGNWVENTSHPIMLDTPGTGNIEDLYDIAYYTTMYRVCPDGNVLQIPTLTAAGLRNSINSSCNDLVGIPNHVIALETETGFCAPSGNFIGKIKNYGSNNVTNATLNLIKNGVVIGTKSFSGVIPQFSTQEITFDPITVQTGSIYTYEIANINGGANHLSAFSSANLKYHTASAATGIELTAKIYTYVCPNNMSWQIRDSAENIVYSAGPYQGGGSGLCGGPLANSVITHNLTLPSTPDCYTIELMDSNGYGWKNYSGNSTTLSGIQVLHGSSLVYENLDVGNFGTLLRLENVFTTNTLGTVDFTTLSTVEMYPNPSNGIVNFVGDMPLEITVFDITGKEVLSLTSEVGQTVADFSNLESGIYLVHLQRDNDTVIKKLIIN